MLLPLLPPRYSALFYAIPITFNVATLLLSAMLSAPLMPYATYAVIIYHAADDAACHTL